MINRFSQFLVEEEKTVYFTFGRMNPPTIGHGKLFDTLAQKAGKNPYRIFLTQSQDKNKNPLQYKQKVKHVRKMFPKHARSVMVNTKVNRPIDAVTVLYNEGFRNLVMIVGSDQVNAFDVLLKKYNGKEAKHGFYNFNKINVISAGARDPDAEGIEGMSASKQRENAKQNDFTAFAQGLPKAMSNPDAKRLFNDVRKAMGLKEAKDFKNHIQLEPVSDLREAYLRDNIFEEGEQVVMTKNGIVGNIKHLGTNYLIVESKGETWRCWLDDVSKVDPNFEPTWDVQDLPNDDFDGVIREALNEEKTPYEWGTPESTKHAKKMTPGEKNEGNGLWANIRAKRARGERMRKKGEKGAPTQDQIKRAQGEAVSPAQQAAIAISKKERGEKPMKEYGGPKISRKDYLKSKPMEAKTDQDPDIKDREGTQPKRYHSGLKKATKIARDRHFNKHGKKADSDPSAYKDAPGDKEARKKGMPKSKHTKFVNRMMGEQDSPMAKAKKTIDREMDAERIRDDEMKKRHDKMLDRARRARMLQRNRGVSSA